MLLLSSVINAGAQPVSLQSLLMELTNHAALAQLPEPSYQALAASSYNRASYNRTQPDQGFNGWYADGDGQGFLRTETNVLSGAKEWVVMEHSGPGCITRIWTPFFYYSFNDRVGPHVRIYLDGDDKPVFDESLIKLVTAQGSIESPFAAYTARAGDLYLPIPFAKSCKITMAAKPFYYNIAYSTYPSGTPVTTFSLADWQALAPLRASVGAALAAGPGAALGALQTNSFRLVPGAGSSLSLPSGSNAVAQLTFRFPSAATNPAVLRSSVLAMTFDDEQTIWCPLGDFFSSPDSIHPFQTLQRKVTADGTMTCAWAMPYRVSGLLQVINEANQNVDGVVEVATVPWNWNERSMHFHATWRPDQIVPGTPPSDWNYADIQGRGLYLGDSWMVLNIQPNSWWGEGDEKIYVDDAWDNGFPSQFGTGSEDYYGWAGGVLPTRADEFSHPFLSNVRVGGLDGCTVGYNLNTRERGLDAIPFDQRLVFDMESSFGVDIRNDWNLLAYSAVTYWYALPGATDNRPPRPEAASKPLISLAQVQAKSNLLRYGVHSGTGPGARWDLGEEDAGAAPGGAGQPVTNDSIGTNALSATGTPVYSANTPPGANSTLSMSFDGASYYRASGTGISNLYSGIDFNHFSLSCDVFMTAPGISGFSFPVSLGSTSTGGGGLAIVEIGGTWEIIHHLVQETSGGPAVALNTWAHLEMVRRDFGGAVQTRLFVNGADSGLSLISPPIDPRPFLTIGANPNPEATEGIEGCFKGQIDNVWLRNLNPAHASLQLRLLGPSAEMECVGPPSAPFTLWRSSRLYPATWTSVATAFADVNGASLLVDSNRPSSQAFYRATSP